MSTNKSDKTRIVQIWGEILDEGFTSVPNILLRYRKNLGIKPKHLSLIIDIMSFKWDSENPFPSYTTLAIRADMEERSIKRTMQELEELGLLIKTPRFDEESGAQITTIFDFRPLIKKLTEEKKKATNDKKDIRGVTKLSPGGMTELSQMGVTELSLGGVTKLSPKEYTYINNKTISKNPIKETGAMTKLAYLKTKKEEKERVRKYLRNGIFRNRIFETFDNLNKELSLADLVEEGSYKAGKELLVNRFKEISDSDISFNPSSVAEAVKKKFPYDEFPKDSNNARKFYVAKICDMTSEEVINFLTR
ncbi:MAG: helix-turn-helix domain-containing protein [Thermodesulfobacteriota bacterium]